MKTTQMVKELERAAQQFGMQVRLEKGAFRGGACTVTGDKYIVLNRLHPPDLHFAMLAESLRGFDLDAVFLPPAVRSRVEEVWARTAAAPETAEPE